MARPTGFTHTTSTERQPWLDHDKRITARMCVDESCVRPCLSTLRANPERSIYRPIESRWARLLWKSTQVRLTEDMMRVVLEQRLGFVATVTRDGRPNLSPKGTTTVLDNEHLLFADIASPGTVTNLASSPFVEVNVVDPIRRKGYRFKGRGEVHRGGERFEQGLDVLEQRGYTTPRERIRAVVIIDVEEAAPVVSPVYAEGAQEEAVAAAWLEHHRKLNS